MVQYAIKRAETDDGVIDPLLHPSIVSAVQYMQKYEKDYHQNTGCYFYLWTVLRTDDQGITFQSLTDNELAEYRAFRNE